jgi:succinate dehydrogenase / fumarate reductase, cytochrome b subunit
MIDVGRIWRSSAGTKAVMAVSGMTLFGFTIVHMLGNLNMILGREHMNGYAQTLHAVPEVVYATRVVLLVSIVAHVAAMVKTRGESIAARPVAYKVVTPKASTIYSRTMRVTGPILLAFIVLHLLNLTFHDVGGNALHPGFKLQEDGHTPDAYGNLASLLQLPLWGIFYLVANACLGFHLWHGAVAMFRSLGLSSERHLGTARMGATALTALVAGGNMLLAAGILFRIIGQG